MKVEVGKSYRCRDGKVRKVVSLCCNGSVANLSEGYTVFTDTGRSNRHMAHEAPQDCLEEVHELVTTKTISKEVFVYDGQEYATKYDLAKRVQRDVYLTFVHDPVSVNDDQFQRIELFVKLVRELNEGSK